MEDRRHDGDRSKDGQKIHSLAGVRRKLDVVEDESDEDEDEDEAAAAGGKAPAPQAKASAAVPAVPAALMPGQGRRHLQASDERVHTLLERKARRAFETESDSTER